uniref:Uncharacterized protein n=1 Tax=Avena sativa TaxID=4498 RepID=A0ACD5TZ99_AVESA
MSAVVHFSPPPVLVSSSSFLFSRSYPREGLMADSPASHLADEATDPDSSGAIHGAPRGTKEQEEMKGEPAIATSEPMREELVQSAVSFLKHPKVVASSDVQRRSFLENKGLTVDEIEEAFRRLLSPPSNSTSSDTCKSQGVSDSSCRVTQEAKISIECVDGSGTPDPETVTLVVPRHPKSYMEVMEMIQRGERPDDIQDINDEPPNPDQPISEPRMTPKPKPWEKQGQESSSLDLKAHPSDSSEPTSGAQTDRTNHSMESNNNSDHGDALLIAEPAMGSEAPADDDAAPLEQ